MRLSILQSLALIAMLSACMASGKEVKEFQLQQFHKGTTTSAEVLKVLGPPNASSLMNDGHRIFVYSYVTAAARPESFIPIMGPLIGGADARATMVSFTFDPNGILQAWSSTSSQSGTGTGLASGAKQERIKDEPQAAPKD